MNSVFRRIGRSLDIPYVRLGRDQFSYPSDLKVPSILSSAQSKFWSYRGLLKRADARIFHLIRDPRDIVISAMHYHRKADEKWLLVPEERFGGLTYQAYTNSLPDDHARLLFEMTSGVGGVIESIGRWDYARPNAIEVKYEDLIADSEMVLFARIAEHLGFADDDMDACKEAFWQHSLFGGKADVEKTVHVRSGTAKQWETTFDRELGEAFVSRFGDILVKLEYEPDNSWIARLEQRTEPGSNRRASA